MKPNGWSQKKLILNILLQPKVDVVYVSATKAAITLQKRRHVGEIKDWNYSLKPSFWMTVSHPRCSAHVNNEICMGVHTACSLQPVSAHLDLKHTPWSPFRQGFLRLKSSRYPRKVNIDRWLSLNQNCGTGSHFERLRNQRCSKRDHIFNCPPNSERVISSFLFLKAVQ